MKKRDNVVCIVLECQSGSVGQNGSTPVGQNGSTPGGQVAPKR